MQITVEPNVHRELKGNGFVGLDNQLINPNDHRISTYNQEDQRILTTKSKIEPSLTIFQRREKLCKQFQDDFYILLKDLREFQDVDDKHQVYQRVQKTLADPEYDLYKTLPDSNSDTITVIQALVALEPSHFSSKSVEPPLQDYEQLGIEHEIEASLYKVMASIGSATKSQLAKIFPYFDKLQEHKDKINSIPADKSTLYLSRLTSIGLRLFDIANSEHKVFQNYENGKWSVFSLLSDEMFANSNFVDWLVENTHVANKVGLSKVEQRGNSIKLLNRLVNLREANGNHKDSLAPGYLEKSYAELEHFFKLAMSKKENLDGFDPVQLIVLYQDAVPEELLKKLLTWADEKNYDFKNSKLTCTDEDLVETFGTNANLLKLVIKPIDDDTRYLPRPSLVKFLLEQGVSPFEEFTIQVKQSNSCKTCMDAERKSEWLELLKESNAQKIIDFLSKSNVDLRSNAFEANLFYLEDAALECRLEEISSRKEIARLMLEYK